MKQKLGLEPPWTIISSVVLGYPEFSQDGMVSREYRPVTWFRNGGGQSRDRNIGREDSFLKGCGDNFVIIVVKHLRTKILTIPK